MPAFSAVMNGQDVIDAFLRVSAGMRADIVKELEVASSLVTAVMRENAPVGVGGEEGLKGSIGFVVNPVTLTSEIKPTAPYADAVETGSRPHWPPHGPDSALAAWTKLKGLNVYAVAASIARKGTKPHPFIEPTFLETEVPVLESFFTGISQFLAGVLA
jgi:hypothetical protein